MLVIPIDNPIPKPHNNKLSLFLISPLFFAFAMLIGIEDDVVLPISLISIYTLFELSFLFRFSKIIPLA